MKNRIVFVTPPNGNKIYNNFTCGLFSLGTILSKNYFVKIVNIDYLFTIKTIKKSSDIEENVETIANYILSLNPNVVSFYTMSNTYYLSIYLSKYIKEHNPDIKVVFGGPQATLTAEITLKEYRFIDCIGLGEGEKTIENIIYNLIHDIEFTEEKGVAFRKGNKIIQNDMELIENLDDIPQYDFSLLEGEFSGKFDIDVGRGCPFNCKYCSTKTFWKKKYRLKTIDRILDEMEYVYDKYNIKYFNFEHDMFTFNKKYILSFCDKLIEKKLDITWGCSSRIDTLDDELIERLSLSGCDKMYIGVETGSQRMQKVINKNYKIEKVINVIALLKKHNIMPIVSFIYGLPEETEEDLEDTLTLIEQLFSIKVYNVQCHLFSVLPGTEYFNQLKDKLYFSKTISDISLCEYMDIEKLDADSVNKELVSQYLDFDLGIRQGITDFNLYEVCCLKTLVKCFARTYSYIKTVIKSNVKLYREYQQFCESDDNINLNIDNYYIQDVKLNIKITEKFLKYIFNKYNLAENNLINEVYKFEADISDFMYCMEEKSMEYKYKYDVYQYFVNKSIVEKNITIEMKREDGYKKVNIKKLETV